MKIDKEIKSLIPPLTEQEYKGLETSVKEEGCRDALVIWKEKNILLDGHNRRKICRKYKIKYRIIHKSFANRNKAEKWVVINQFSRRNLAIWKRCVLVLKLKSIIAAEAKERQKIAGKQHGRGQKKVPLNSKEPIDETYYSQEICTQSYPS